MLSIKELFTFFSLYSIEFTLGVRKDQIVVSRQSTSVPSVGDAPRNCLDLRHRASNTGSTSDVIVIVYPARAVSSNRPDEFLESGSESSRNDGLLTIRTNSNFGRYDTVAIFDVDIAFLPLFFLVGSGSVGLVVFGCFQQFGNVLKREAVRSRRGSCGRDSGDFIW
jgi:hypothetical protein